MAGYSAKPLVDKLGIKAEARIAVIGAPPDFDLGPLPAGVVSGRLRADLDVVLAFVTRRAVLEQRWAAWTRAMRSNGGLWVAWPKRSSGVATDMTEDVVRAVALPTGWVDNKVCAVDDTWSGLRCVLRVALRAKE